MKKIYAILILVSLASVFNACKKDSATKPTPEKTISKIEGSWKVDYREYKMYAGGKLVTSYTEKDKSNAQATFNTDGSGTFSSGTNEQTKFNFIFTDEILKFTNVEFFGSATNYKWISTTNFEYTDVKLGVNELSYTTKGEIAQPALYTNYVARVHLIK